MKRIARTALVLLCAALVLPPLASCGSFKSRPSGVYVEEGTEYPFSCKIEGDTFVWCLSGEEQYRTSFRLAYQKAGTGRYAGKYRLTTDGMPFPDPCDDMLFWDRDNDLFVYSFFSTDGITHESYLTPGREG